MYNDINNGQNSVATSAEKYYAKDLKSNKKSKLYDTPQEAGVYAKEWNRNGGFALVFRCTSNESYEKFV